MNRKPTWQSHACFSRNCADWAAGASHKCETGKCKKFERALAEWEDEKRRIVQEMLEDLLELLEVGEYLHASRPRSNMAIMAVKRCDGHALVPGGHNPVELLTKRI